MFWILLVPHYGLILQRCAAIWLDIVEGMGELTTWCGKWENIRSLPSLSILCIVCLIIQCFCWFLQLIYCKWIWLSDYYWVYNFHWRWLLCQVWEVGLSTFFQTPARPVEPSKGESFAAVNIPVSGPVFCMAMWKSAPAQPSWETKWHHSNKAFPVS